MVLFFGVYWVSALFYLRAFFFFFKRESLLFLLFALFLCLCVPPHTLHIAVVCTWVSMERIGGGLDYFLAIHKNAMVGRAQAVQPPPFTFFSLSTHPGVHFLLL